MSGHNKWSKIKRGKQVKDKQKSNIFSKLARMISLTIIEAGGITDPENNIKLRLAIEKAKSLNFPKENIERAIEKGVGPDRQQLKEILYEGFGPGGVALIILATSDNPNRTLIEIRRVLEQHNGKLGKQGSVVYLFKKCGLATFRIKENTEKSVIDFADKIRAFDIDEDGEYFYIYIPYEHLGKVRDYLSNLKVNSVEIDFKPNTLVEISAENTVNKIIELIEALEGLEDIQKVFTNEKIK